MSKKTAALVILAACIGLCAGCGLQNTAGGSTGTSSGSAVSSNASGTAVEANVSTGAVTAVEKAKAALPDIETIIKEFEYMAGFSEQYPNAVEPDTEAGTRMLRKKEMLDKDLKVKVYTRRAYLEGQAEVYPCWSLICEVSPVENPEVKGYIEMRYSKNGFWSVYQKRKKRSEKYIYLGEGTAFIEGKALDEFEYKPENTKRRKKFLAQMKKQIKKDCGPGRAYVPEFREGDPFVDGYFIEYDDETKQTRINTLNFERDTPLWIKYSKFWEDIAPEQYLLDVESMWIHGKPALVYDIYEDGEARER
ncbi:MAG: hypothetical protein J1F02_01405 [Lachnospiraceae bacterium]|nr:hypothetical protein [Lachnospiraceae bacterium]